MKIPKILTETPNMEHPTMGFPTRDHPLTGFPTTEHPTTNNPIFDLPPAYLVDSDRDGVIDPWDCQPFNPDADGLIGDLYRKAKAFVKPDYGRAARRRQAVRQRVSGGVSRGVSAARGGIGAAGRGARELARRAPIHVSRRRAAERRAGVVGRVKDVHKRLTTSRLPVRGGRVKPFAAYSREAAAGRRAKIAGKLERIGAKVGVDFERAAERRAIVRNVARELNAPLTPVTTYGIPAQPTQRRTVRQVRDLPEPDLDASEW